MLGLKRTTLAVLTLGSSAVFAGSMGPVCTPGNVTVPCASSAWDIGGQALYLQTNLNKDLSYQSTNNDGLYRDLSGQWSWGFQLEGSYHFNTGNDATLTWYHLDGKGLRLSLPNFGSTETANVIASNQWDAVNGELGQFVDFSANKKMRFHGGFQWARVKTAYNFTDVATGSFPFTSIIGINMQYAGFGPRAGLDMNYVLNSGFGIYAKAATALLIGSNKYTMPTTFLAPTAPDFSGTTTYRGSRTAAVPELEAKLGGTYTYPIAQGQLVLDAGYMWFNYFNAVTSKSGSSNNTTAATTTTDFGANGPYVGLKYVGNL